MAPRFLRKTTLTGIEPLRSSAGLVLDGYAGLRMALTEALGSGAGELLAEPVITWGNDSAEGSISWYTEAVGEPAALGAITAERRLALEDRLRGLLSRIGPALADPSRGPSLQRALCVLSPASLWVVGNQVVLTEWGLAPLGQAGGDGMALLRRSPLGAFLPAEALNAGPASVFPTAPASSPASRSPSPATVPAAASAQVPMPQMPPPGPPKSVSPKSRLSPGWWPVPAALAIAALFLVLGYWKGSLLAAERAAQRQNEVSLFDEAAVRDATQRQLDLNTALEKQIEERRRLLAGNVCLADPAAMPRIGPDRASAPPASVIPPPPGGQPFRGNLADLLKQALVLVVVPTGTDDVAIGSGFYVTTDTIVTNRHVIEKAQNGKVGVTNEKLGKLVPAEIVATSPNSDIGSLDIAILHVPSNPAVQPLSLTPTVAELDPVIAAGYPALVIRGDAATARLLSDGDLTAAPQLVLTDGRINAIQTTSAGVKVMPHSANISGGNSGGPLVDACGRVVGVNTYIKTDQEQTAHANYAQKSDVIIEFLKAHNVPISELSGPCPPPPGPASPAPTAPAPASPAPTSPAPAPAAPGALPPPAFGVPAPAAPAR